MQNQIKVDKNRKGILFSLNEDCSSIIYRELTDIRNSPKDIPN